MPIRASQARPAYAPPRSSSARPPDWAVDLGLGSRPAPLASISVHRLRHQPPSPPAQSDLGASSSAHLVDRPLSTPTATRRLVDAFRRRPRRYKTRLKQGGWALLQRESRCVLVLPAPPFGPPRRPSLARASSSRRFEDATMSLLESLARRAVTHDGWTGLTSGAGAGGRPRAVHLGPCTSLLLALLVPQARACTLAPL